MGKKSCIPSVLGEEIITKTNDFLEVPSIVMYDGEPWLSLAKTQRDTPG